MEEIRVSEDRRSEVLQTRVTRNELTAIKAAAAAVDTPVSGFVRDVLMDHTHNGAVSQDWTARAQLLAAEAEVVDRYQPRLDAVLNELAAQGRVLNQIARKVNAGQYIPDDASVLHALNEAHERVSAAQCTMREFVKAMGYESASSLGIYRKAPDDYSDSFPYEVTKADED